jgi:mannose-6-phosphate isomerase
MRPISLRPKFVERVWGATALDPWYPPVDRRIGEVWLSSDDIETSEGAPLGELTSRPEIMGTAVAGGRFPILVKFLFTTEKLSVQVHPEDEYAFAHHEQPGKTEMWYVLNAQPEAVIAQGFTRDTTEAELRQSLAEGTVESLLEWWPAAAGQTYFTPARTVHAIGGGLAICEIQQNSDVTYRLWDYGRPRELHVEPSIAVLDWGRAAGPQPPQGALLASCPYFATERHRLHGPVAWSSDAERFHLLVITAGDGLLSWGGEVEEVRAGQAWLMPAALGGYILDGTPELEVLRVWVPSR